MFKGLYMNVQFSISYQSKIELSYYRVMHNIGRLPKICHWWKISALRSVPGGAHPRCLAGRAQRRLT